MTKVVVKKRSEGWNAILADNHQCWEWAETIDAALIQLIRSYPEKFNLSPEQIDIADPYDVLRAAQGFEVKFA